MLSVNPLNHRISKTPSFKSLPYIKALQTSLVILKPDAFERGLVNKITAMMMDKTGVYIMDAKIGKPYVERLERHYSHYKNEDFYEELIEYMTRGNLKVMTVRSENAIKDILKFAQDIRAMFNCGKLENLIHASDSKASAKREIANFDSFF